MPITTLPTPPAPSDSPATFNTNAFALLGALPNFVTEANNLGAESAAAATSAANAVLASKLNNTNPSYTGTLTGGTGVVNLGSGQLVKDASGNVGVGTANPLAKLDVVAGGAASFDVQAVAQLKSASDANGNAVEMLFTPLISGQSRTAIGGVREGVTANAALYFATNNAERARIDSAGNFGLGVTPSAWNGSYRALQLAGGGYIAFSNMYGQIGANSFLNGAGVNTYISSGLATQYEQSGGAHIWKTAPSGTAGSPITFTQAMTLDASGNLNVGATGYGYHVIGKNMGSTAGTSALLAIQNVGTDNVALFMDGASVSSSSATGCALRVGLANTGRSINAGGTINQSGADYAEYERNNGLSIVKGSIVGFKADGTLTLTFAEAIRFGVKSTAPGLVGGDTWADGIGERPTKPEFTPPAYKGPAAPGEEPTAPADDADQAVIDAYAEARAALSEAMADHDAAMAEYTAAVVKAQAVFDDVTMPVYEAELAAFEARLEAARQMVDRIAYSGKVPCNVAGATPGDYIVATAAADGSITGVSVTEPDFAQYRKAVGRVNRLLPDGRCEVAVIIH